MMIIAMVIYALEREAIDMDICWHHHFLFAGAFAYFALANLIGMMCGVSVDSTFMKAKLEEVAAELQAEATSDTFDECGFQREQHHVGQIEIGGCWGANFR